MSEGPTTAELDALVQRFGDALNARDFDALTRFYAPDAVVSFGVLGSHEGQAAIRVFYEDWVGAFGDFENDFEEIRDLGGGVLFIVFAQRGRPPGSPNWVHVRVAAVLIMGDGLIRRQTNNAEIGEARASAERLAEERR